MGRLLDGVVLRRCSGIFGALVLVSLLWGSGVAAPAAHDAADLRGQWHLDEGAPGSGDDAVGSTPDSSGNNLTAVVRYTGQVPGRFGTAFRFDQSSWVFTTSALLRPQQLTAMAWVRADQSPGTLRYVLAQGAGGDGVCIPAAYGMYTSVAGDVNAGGLSFYVTNAGHPYHAPGVPASKVWDGKWHMVAGTFDGSTAHFYLDGTKIGNGTAVPGAIDYSQPTAYFTIGAYGQPFNRSCAPTITAFKGDIDEVRIYTGAMLPDDVQRISDWGSSSPPPPTVPAPPMVPVPPIVHTLGADQITSSSARIYGTINDHGTPVSYAVEYGQTTAYGQTSGTQRTAGMIDVSLTLGNLSPASVYHARIISGSARGEDITFRTGNAPSAAPTTTITLDPAAPGPEGYYTNFVKVTVTATGRAPLETRCVLDPLKPPTSFDDLPSGCRFTGGARVSGLGTRTVYAAVRDGSGLEAPMVASRTFRLSEVPETTIESGASGLTWRPNNLFYFSSNVNPAKFECRVDAAAFARCTNPYETGTLSQTDHIFAVRAIAPGGAVDPTPAQRTFKVASPLSVRASCQVKPVYWLYVTGFEHGYKVGCEIGTLGRDGCVSVLNCVVKRQRCPVGARCTITTKASWFDADAYLNWGVSARSMVRNIFAVRGGWQDEPTWTYAYALLPDREELCTTGFDGDRCFATASLEVLGEGRPLLSACILSVGNQLWYRTFVKPGVDPSGAALKRRLDDSIRRIECDAEWHVYPAPELAAVPAGKLLQVSVSSPGMLSALFTILGATNASRLAASARPQGTSAGPQIAPVRKAVTRAGTVAIPLKLNAAAQRLLKQKKQLTVSLRLNFTRKGGRKVTRTQRVTITAPQARPRICRVQQPKKPATKLPGCLARQ